MSKDWLDELLFSTPDTAPVAVEESHRKPEEKPKIGGFPRQAQNWGSGRKADPFLSSAVSRQGNPVSGTDDLTPDEAAELRKHEETARKETRKRLETHRVPPVPEKPPAIPPMPTEPPTNDRPVKLTEGVRSAVDKAMSSDPGKAIGWIAQKFAPVGEKLSGARNAFDASREKKWNILWSTAAAWLISPGALVAIYDRALLMFGVTSDSVPRADYLASGGEAHTWDLVQGLAMWTKETVGAALEAGLADRVVIAVAVSVVPQLVMSINARWALWLSWMGTAAFVAFFWAPQWWEVYLSTLAGCAYYGWTMAKRFRSDFLAFLFRIPMAAFVTGIISYSPGAIF